MPLFNFDNSYARELEGAFVPWQGAAVPRARMLRFNEALAEELGLEAEALKGDAGALIFSGAQSPEGAAPLAMAYAGHQFGGFSPQLGDGRALLVGEIIAPSGARFDLHLKGSGRTPFSRGGDGKAVLGPVLREYLMGEAMHGLGVPTTRALAAVTTGETVLRDTGPEQGAVLARIAASHLRVGTFQFFAARGQLEELKRVADYAIARHDPDLAETEGRYLAFLGRVVARQARLIARWMGLGFVHGVMNTDNMTISGETIDYGPCAFMDVYDPRSVFSSIDAHGRYAFGNQPNIAQWNLARLAESLLDLINPDDSDAAIEAATDVLNHFPDAYQAAFAEVMRGKMGLAEGQEGDSALGRDFLTLLEAQGADFTQSFRALAGLLEGDEAALGQHLTDPAALGPWAERFAARHAQEAEPLDARIKRMSRWNPIYIPRNHKVEEALNAAREGDMWPFETLLKLVQSPFERQDGHEAFERGAPAEFGRYVTYCGT